MKHLFLVLCISATLSSCAASPEKSLPAHAVSGSFDAGGILEYLSPDAVNIQGLEQTELAQANSQILEILEQADTLARSRIGYRTDKRSDPLTRAGMHRLPDNLSCTEFIWLVYSLSGMDLSNFHIETKEMAYDKGVYSPFLVKLKPTEAVQPGDTLIYEYSDRELIREEEQTGHFRSGHAVMVVSAKRKIVVGSHGAESTPPGAPTGVGYRRLLKDWDKWTAERSLKAIYRPNLNLTAGDPKKTGISSKDDPPFKSSAP
jgi:hypothetical protein